MGHMHNWKSWDRWNVPKFETFFWQGVWNLWDMCGELLQNLRIAGCQYIKENKYTTSTIKKHTTASPSWCLDNFSVRTNSCASWWVFLGAPLTSRFKDVHCFSRRPQQAVCGLCITIGEEFWAFWVLCSVVSWSPRKPYFGLGLFGWAPPEASLPASG